MKTLNKKITFAAMFAMLCMAGGHAQNKNAAGNEMKIFPGSPGQDNDAREDAVSQVMKLNIVVLAKRSILRDASVNIYHENRLIAVLNSGIQHTMNVELKSNSYYIIEVFSPGYRTKSIMVSTLFPADTINDTNTIYEHTVFISLLKQFTTKEMNETNPVQLTGIIYYDMEKDNFFGSPMIKESEDKQAIIAQIEAWLDF